MWGSRSSSIHLVRGVTIAIASVLVPLCLAAEKPAAFGVPKNVIWEPDLEYSVAGGKGQRLAMDVIRPIASGPHPAVVCVHGGGFRAGNRERFLSLCVRLAERGYIAATVSYRLAPLYQFPSPVQDVKTAIRWIRANSSRFDLDPERIGILGESAGAHLALFAGLTPDVAEFEGAGPNLDRSSRVSCVVNYFGPTNFTKSYGKSRDAAEVLPLFLGGDLDHERAAHIRASPLNWISPRAAPVLTIHGTEDEYVAHEQAVWLTDRLRAAGVETELETIEGAGHGFRGADAERAERRTFEFLDKHLMKRATERELVIADHGSAGEILGISWPSGRVLWRTPNARGRDVQALPDGHVLYTMDATRRVVEIDHDHRVVWTYGAAEGLQMPVAAQRLRNGNTLIGDAQLGEIREVNHDGRIVWTYRSQEIGGMRMRNCRRIEAGESAGNTLAVVEASGRVVEVSPAGQVVRTIDLPGGARRAPYQALRLQGGNTLIGMADPGEVVEMDLSGSIVRRIAGDRTDVRLGWVTGIELLDDGGLLIADYLGRRIIEVDPGGTVRHQWATGPRDIASISLAPKLTR
jgi:acetyl esterase/lipase